MGAKKRTLDIVSHCHRQTTFLSFFSSLSVYANALHWIISINGIHFSEFQAELLLHCTLRQSCACCYISFAYTLLSDVSWMCSVFRIVFVRILLVKLSVCQSICISLSLSHFLCLCSVLGRISLNTNTQTHLNAKIYTVVIKLNWFVQIHTCIHSTYTRTNQIFYFIEELFILVAEIMAKRVVDVRPLKFKLDCEVRADVWPSMGTRSLTCQLICALNACRAPYVYIYFAFKSYSKYKSTILFW